MKRLGFVLGITVFCMGLGSVALGQDITSKLGNTSGATFTVEDSDGNDILVLEAKDQTTQSPNIIGGHDVNSVTSGVWGAVVGGGGRAAYPNTVTDHFGTVGGGAMNQAESYATVGGGGSNQASGHYATVGGGGSNTANNYYATVGGGGDNTAGNGYATVGGGDSNQANGGYSTIGGGQSNTAGSSNATIGGGELNAAGANATVGGGLENVAVGEYSTVGGGYGNQATAKYATIAGGGGNEGSGWHYENKVTDKWGTVGGGGKNQAGGDSSATDDASFATVGGGYRNKASGKYATVPGGNENTAAGDYSFAAGGNAKADHRGSFVWSDGSGATVESAENYAWYVRASGGVTFYTSADFLKWVHLPADGNSWSAGCDRANKENFAEVDKRETLEKLVAMPITEYNLKGQDASIIHFGPVAQDFAAVFGYGEEKLLINMMDAVGVAMASVQGLYQVVKEKDEEIRALKRSMARLHEETLAHTARNAALEDRLNRLEQALAPRMARAAPDVKP
jgi:trimeric autotransporter adhesin